MSFKAISLDECVSKCDFHQNKQGSVFLIKTANETIEEAKKIENPKQLFGELWTENEICILFSDTNVGKSILSVQIAEQIASGNSSILPITASAQKVLLIDLELSDKQFQIRYTNEESGCSHIMNPNFSRARLDIDSALLNGTKIEDAILENLEIAIGESGFKVVIIDNITYLAQEQEKSKNALPLMRSLKTLQEKLKLSILVLAHTPKRDMTKPITKNDLAGSKMLMNFSDSSFTIGASSKGKSTRYIKQIKCRNYSIAYDSDNVLECIIEKRDNFLQFIQTGKGKESDHLIEHISPKLALKREIAKMHNEQPELSNQQIADKLGTYSKMVYRVINGK